MKGNLIKLSSQHTTPVTYTMHLGDDELVLNDLIGKKLDIAFTGRINCMACRKQTKSSFAQGYCYNCFQTRPETEECILRPELCRAHLDEGRDLQWAKDNHLQAHVVYLAYSSNVKVGVTRATQMPTRWIDQGASLALPFLKTPNRHIAGLAEVYLKQKFSDKTNWKKMLVPKSLMEPDLNGEVEIALDFLPSELKKYYFKSDVYGIDFPVVNYPETIKSISLDKQASFSGVLAGIKGQYLIFKSGEVLNVRKHSGYYIKLSHED